MNGKMRMGRVVQGYKGRRNAMTNTLNPILRIGLLFCVMAGGQVLLLPSSSYAVNCPTASTSDFDQDGFSDMLECNGTTTQGATPLAVPSCSVTNPTTPGERATCLDPNTKDLFVILSKPTSGSQIEALLVTQGRDPLLVLRKTLEEGGLGIIVHELSFDQAPVTRQVSADSSQKAIRITENLDPDGVVTGICTQGTPNGLDGCTVYTQRIVNLITSTCNGKLCAIDAGSGAVDTTIDDVIATYIQNTLAHEPSHSLGLAPDYNKKLGGNHYGTSSKVVMSQSVSYINRNTRATFFLDNVFASSDSGSARLK